MGKAFSEQSHQWPYRRYKQFRTPLKLASANWFKSHGYSTRPKYDYILSSPDEWHKNIILQEIADFIECIKKERESNHEGFALHRDKHNGLSSQAMLFNLIGPLVIRNDVSLLGPAFRKYNIPFPEEITGCKFELEDRDVFNERQAQPTSFDFAIFGEQNTNSLYIESKFVEQEFGGCSVFRDGDCDGRNPAKDPSACYLHHIGRKYWNLLEQYGFLQGDMSSSPICLLAAHYQFYRELLFALNRNGYYVLLYDERSPVFINDGSMGQRGLWPFLLSFVPHNLKGRTAAISIQKVFSAISSSINHADWTGEFALKYGLTDHNS